MLGLITNRASGNISYRAKLAAKGWSGMTLSEQAEWTGDPLTAANFTYADPVNLLPRQPESVSGMTVVSRNSGVVATVSATDASAVYVIGEAELFTGKTLTFSSQGMGATAGTVNAELFWYDAAGRDAVGAKLSSEGQVTVTLDDNPNGRAHLACVLSLVSGSAGAKARYEGLMLEMGSIRHSYVPYTPILPTTVTKGSYNYSDLNRVELAVAEIAESLGLNLQTRTNWTVWDVPTHADMSRFLNNLAIIREACPNTNNISEPPIRMMDLTYNVANAIETLVSDVYASTNAIVRTGDDLYCGEV